MARGARDPENGEKFQGELRSEDRHSREIMAPESSRHRQMIAKKSEELKKIEREYKKSELERLQEEVGTQLKRELAATEDNRESNKIQARGSREKKGFRHELEDEEEDGELELQKFEVRPSSVKLSWNIFEKYLLSFNLA